MDVSSLLLLGVVRALFRPRAELVLENLALRAAAGRAASQRSATEYPPGGSMVLGHVAELLVALDRSAHLREA
jgi:hypothetical protein